MGMDLGCLNCLAIPCLQAPDTPMAILVELEPASTAAHGCAHYANVTMRQMGACPPPDKSREHPGLALHAFDPNENCFDRWRGLSFLTI